MEARSLSADGRSGRGTRARADVLHYRLTGERRDRDDAMSNLDPSRMMLREPVRTRAVRIDVIAYAPTAFYHCQHCEVAFDEVGVGRRIRAEQLAGALPDDLLHDYQALSDWVRALTESYCGRIVVKVIDAASVEGFWKSLRHRVRRYPAVIVEGRETCIGIDAAAVRRLIDRYLPAPALMVKTGAGSGRGDAPR